jgi:hypothetical protein
MVEPHSIIRPAGSALQWWRNRWFRRLAPDMKVEGTNLMYRHLGKRAVTVTVQRWYGTPVGVPYGPTQTHTVQGQEPVVVAPDRWTKVATVGPPVTKVSGIVRPALPEWTQRRPLRWLDGLLQMKFDATL